MGCWRQTPPASPIWPRRTTTLWEQRVELFLNRSSRRGRLLEDAEDHRGRPNRHLVFVGELRGGFDSFPAQERPVPAVEIFQNRPRFVDHDSCMPARHESIVDPDDGIFIASKQVLAEIHGYFAVSPDESVDQLLASGGGNASSKLLRASAEGVTKAVNCPHETGLSSVVPGRRPDLDEKTGERTVRNERARPEALVDLALGKRFGTALQQQLQKLKSLGGEMNGLAANRELPRIGVEHALPESNPHRRSQKNLGNFQCFADDFPTSRRSDYPARRETMKNAAHNHFRRLFPSSCREEKR